MRTRHGAVVYQGEAIAGAVIDVSVEGVVAGVQATARKPSATELRILVAGLKNQLADFKQDTKSAEKLLQVGEHPVNKKLDPAELAAYTALCSLILNLDETVTKE